MQSKLQKLININSMAYFSPIFPFWTKRNLRDLHVCSSIEWENEIIQSHAQESFQHLKQMMAATSWNLLRNVQKRKCSDMIWCTSRHIYICNCSKDIPCIASKQNYGGCEYTDLGRLNTDQDSGDFPYSGVRMTVLDKLRNKASMSTFSIGSTGQRHPRRHLLSTSLCYLNLDNLLRFWLFLRATALFEPLLELDGRARTDDGMPIDVLPFFETHFNGMLFTTVPIVFELSSSTSCLIWSSIWCAQAIDKSRPIESSIGFFQRLVNSSLKAWNDIEGW